MRSSWSATIASSASAPVNSPVRYFSTQMRTGQSPVRDSSATCDLDIIIAGSIASCHAAVSAESPVQPQGAFTWRCASDAAPAHALPDLIL